MVTSSCPFLPEGTPLQFAPRCRRAKMAKVTPVATATAQYPAQTGRSRPSTIWNKWRFS
ncbi:MAG TPA: hypothetical protein VLU91_05115 [Nitrososphaerales archaeon]|nr:hypothetical protein [Nitrososphaerales archaeon]